MPIRITYQPAADLVSQAAHYAGLGEFNRYQTALAEKERDRQFQADRQNQQQQFQLAQQNLANRNAQQRQREAMLFDWAKMGVDRETALRDLALKRDWMVADRETEERNLRERGELAFDRQKDLYRLQAEEIAARTKEHDDRMAQAKLDQTIDEGLASGTWTIDQNTQREITRLEGERNKWFSDTTIPAEDRYKKVDEIDGRIAKYRRGGARPLRPEERPKSTIEQLEAETVLMPDGSRLAKSPKDGKWYEAKPAGKPQDEEWKKGAAQEKQEYIKSQRAEGGAVDPQELRNIDAAHEEAYYLSNPQAEPQGYVPLRVQRQVSAMDNQQLVWLAQNKQRDPHMRNALAAELQQRPGMEPQYRQAIEAVLGQYPQQQQTAGGPPQAGPPQPGQAPPPQAGPPQPGPQAGPPQAGPPQPPQPGLPEQPTVVEQLQGAGQFGPGAIQQPELAPDAREQVAQLPTDQMENFLGNARNVQIADPRIVDMMRDELARRKAMPPTQLSPDIVRNITAMPTERITKFLGDPSALQVADPQVVVLLRAELERRGLGGAPPTAPPTAGQFDEADLVDPDIIGFNPATGEPIRRGPHKPLVQKGTAALGTKLGTVTDLTSPDQLAGLQAGMMVRMPDGSVWEVPQGWTPPAPASP